VFFLLRGPEKVKNILPAEREKREDRNTEHWSTMALPVTSVDFDLTSFTFKGQNMDIQIFVLLFFIVPGVPALVGRIPRLRGLTGSPSAIPEYSELWATVVKREADDTVSTLWLWNDKNDLTAVATLARGRGRRESWRLKAWALLGDAVNFATTASADDGLSAMISSPEAIHQYAGHGTDFRAFTRVTRGAMDAVAAYPLAVLHEPLVVNYAFQEDLIKYVEYSS